MANASASICELTMIIARVFAIACVLPVLMARAYTTTFFFE